MGEFARHLAPYAGASAVEAREVGARLLLTHLSDNQVERRLDAVQNRGGRRRRFQRPARPHCLAAETDRKRVVSGKSMSVREVPGGRRIIKYKNHKSTHNSSTI